MTSQGRRAPTFVDHAVLQCTAGRGGNGCSSHYRDLWMRYPKADGGDGGHGGNIILFVDHNIHTLLDISYRKHVKAGSGKHGTSKRQRGANGEDFRVAVPPGTLIYDNQTGDLLRDLVEPGDELVVAEGGQGGFGNHHRREGTPGEPGQERYVRMELKMMADLGIVGLPNAGKSTLLGAISDARPKVANYPFTTLTPTLGAVGLPVAGKEYPVPCVAVDLPGLIEGAASGKGLGLEFLRHIERTRALLHVVDMAGTEGRDPIEDFNVLNRELAQYNQEVADKPQMVVANKMDLPGAEKNLKKFKAKVKKIKIVAVSAKTGEGISHLLTAAGKLLL